MGSSAPAESHEPDDAAFEAALCSTADVVESVCSPNNVSYLAYHICAFPVPAASRRAAAHAVLLSTRAAGMHDAKAALVEAMVSFHHGYQALQRGIARQ
eukprot:1883576-Pleurochrysis_carterae.AAC.1